MPGGGLPSLSPAAPAFSLLFCPLSPRPPSQREGGDQGYFMQGASPLASPRLNPRGTGSTCRCRRLNGGRAPGVAGSASVSGTRRMAFPPCRLPAPPLACFSAPYPPARARRAIFPGGEGGDQGYFMQGASPLASPRLNPRGTGSTCRCRRLNGGRAPPALLARRALAVPGGGLPSLSSVAPAFSLAFCPPSPQPPSPVGKGETKVILCKGLRPLHPRE